MNVKINANNCQFISNFLLNKFKIARYKNQNEMNFQRIFAIANHHEIFIFLFKRRDRSSNFEIK